MRRQFCIGVVSGIALLCVYLLSLPSHLLHAGTDKPRTIAPNFTLNDSKGVAITLAEFKGKVVLLNFWATWCHGCGEEIPWFVEFQTKYKSQGLTVLGVSMDDDGWEAVLPFIRERKMNYVVVIGDKKLGDQFGLAAMPMTVLIDREGNIASKYEGVVDREGCEKQIRSLLNEKTKNSAD